MSESGSVPITNKKTGETTIGSSSQSRKPKPETTPHSVEIKEQERDQNIDSAPEVAQTESEATTENSQNKKKKKIVKDIESFEDFIIDAYSKKNCRNLKPKELKIISPTTRLSDETKDKLLKIAESDKLLGVTLKILISSIGIENFLGIKNAVRDLARDVLSKHPLFTLIDLQSPQDVAFTVKAITGTNVTIFQQSTGEPLSKKEQSSLKFNAVYCFLLLQHLAKNYSVEKITECLVENLWALDVLHKNDGHKILQSLTGVKEKDAVAIGFAGDIFKKQLSREKQVANQLNKDLEVEKRKSHKQQNKIDLLQTELTENEDQLKILTDELKAEREKHKNTHVHMLDDFENLRSRLLRRLKTEVSLLEDGLHALRRNPPKVNITEDHTERALEGLKKEIKELEQENK